MSFGFSVSDIVISYQLARDIYFHCFTKAQRADVKYFEFGRDIQSLGLSLEGLHRIVTNAKNQRPSGPTWHDDDNEGVTAGVVNTLSEVTGDFQKTLRDCDRLLQDHSKFKRTPANFVENVAWHGGTERDVNSLRERVHFHMMKVNFIAKPFEIQLLLGIRCELQLLTKEVAALRAVLDWDPAQARHSVEPNSHETRSGVPANLSHRFMNALVARDSELSRVPNELPLKEGFDALFYHFTRSTVNFKPSPRSGQDVPVQQYLNLVKSRWIIERLKESTYFQSSGPESLWAEYMRELEDGVNEQLSRFQQGDLPPPLLDILCRLPDECFSIWVDDENSLRPAPLNEHRPSEEKILELPLQRQYSTHPSILTIFRKSDTALRLVSATKDDQNDRFHTAESVDVNMIQTGLVPVFAAPQNPSTVNNNVLLCHQGQDTKYYNLCSSADIAQFQRALTGFRVSHDMSNVSWHIEFRQCTKSGISGQSRLQLWHLKPLPKIQQPRETEQVERESSSSGPIPHSPIGSIDLRRFWTSGTTQLPPVNNSRGDGIALTHPELPVLILFTTCGDKYAFLHLQMDKSIFLEQQSCVSCRSQKTECSRILIKSKAKNFGIRRLCAEREKVQGLASWNLGCFRYPEHPGFKKLEVLSNVKYLSLHFDTVEKRDEFCREFESLVLLRNIDLHDYERALTGTKFLSNNLRSH